MLARRPLNAWFRLFAALLLSGGGVAGTPVRAAELPKAPPAVTVSAEDRGDTKPTMLKDWDPARDLPRPVTSDPSVAFDFPVVYVRVPRPYPKEYNGINHLNQAG